MIPDLTNGTGVTYLEFETPLLRAYKEVTALEANQRESKRDVSADVKQLRTRLKNMTKRMYSHLTAWETVLVARHPQRPLVTDYIRLICRDFCELHGDRLFGDDKALITGFARIGGHKVMLIGHNKGKDTKERVACNFGCAHPEGYRKALAKMKLAAKFKLPVVCLIDTQGAYPGIGAEERGISHAIAVNLMEMSRLRTPIVCVVIGEGGSGGALGIGVGDRVAMFEHSFYSVISPEGCAAILWKTGDQRKRAAESLKLTAKELKKLGIIDEIISEPLGGAHRDPDFAADQLKRYLVGALRDLKRLKVATVVNRRYARIRRLGSFHESPSAKSEAKAGKPTARPPLGSRVPRVTQLSPARTHAPRVAQ